MSNNNSNNNRNEYDEEQVPLVLGVDGDDRETPLVAQPSVPSPRMEEEEEEVVIPHNPWSQQLARIQMYFNFFSHVLAMASIVLVMVWVRKLGGLSWDDQYRTQIFNYHPLFMILAFAFMTVASLKYRVSQCRADSSNKRSQKILHATSNTIALILGIVAVIAVFRSHNDCRNGEKCYANLASLHSWIGMGIIILFLCQFLVASVSFGPIPLSFITPTRKAGILRLHHFGGRFIYAMMAGNICLGIQEKEQFAFHGCSYNVSHEDTNPVEFVGNLSVPCKISHSLGIIIFVMALSTLFAIYEFDLKTPQSPTTTTITAPPAAVAPNDIQPRDLEENVASQQST